ncbi:sulfurtransferase-like selenium metabolism protein YedF [Pelotomaculum propionicicum]|uniref:sulfurtransferase-like selenium metabolism protein YedF n=1 Tax=Pelotomaculum propionicicum TaxID=258475 RepID=UPI003B7C4398
MSSKLLDCRGLACPQPVIETKKAVEAGNDNNILVIVDNAAARENVSRFAANAGCKVDIKEKDGFFHLEITVPERNIIKTGDQAGAKTETPQTAGNVYFIATNSLGQGSPDLGEVLMKSLMVTLTQQDPPAALLFLNTGVYLAVEGSPVLEQLQALAGKGTEILVCGTCLNYYKLNDKLAVGTVSNMLDINTRLTGPYKVISIG